MASNEIEEFEFRARAEAEAKAPKSGKLDYALSEKPGIAEQFVGGAKHAWDRAAASLQAGAGALGLPTGESLEPLVKQGSEFVDKTGPASTIGNVAGEIGVTAVPGIGGYKLASQVGARALPKIMANRFGASAVGGAGAGAAASGTMGDNPLVGAATGAVLGPAGTTIGDIGGWGFNKVRRVFEDAPTQAARKVQGLAGSDAARQAAVLQGLRGEVRGELPTSGLAATVDPRMTYQKELQEQARRRLSGDYAVRDQTNEAARMHDLERLAAQGRKGTATQGGAVPESANELRRSSRTNPLYAAAMPERVTMTPELEALIGGVEARPAVVRGGRAFRQEQTNAEVGGGRVPQGPVAAVPGTPAMPEVRDSMGMLTREAVPEVPGTPGNRSIQDLQQVKNELSERIKRISMSDPDEAHRLSVARNQLNRAMMEQSPNFNQATNTFRQFSQPQNQADIAQVLQNALRTPGGAERASAFLAARQNAAQTLKKADQSPRFEQIEQVMTPTQMRQINAITRSLRREADYENLSRTSLPGTKSANEAAEDVVPPFLSRTTTLLRQGLRKTGINKDTQIDKIIDEATLHPERMAQLLERATPDQRIKVLSTLREMNPKGASIGLIAGQE